MMTAPIFDQLSTYAPLTALIGTSPVRAFPFGLAPDAVAKPYIVWRAVGGGPENYIGERPDIDSFSLQIDIYATTAATARAVAEHARDAIEGAAHIVAWNGEDRDPDTKNYRYSFTVDWWVGR
jgi:uncharacterized protein DUF3168